MRPRYIPPTAIALTSYDTGITEQHAAGLAAGLALAGMRPVLAIYSTFLQRAYDQL
ncbi:MAG: hypothetical protein IKT03_01640, partial [Muribaculaceae bacterium]|nr:hypothetical protein [Muribaculaceae bacterium]